MIIPEFPILSPMLDWDPNPPFPVFIFVASVDEKPVPFVELALPAEPPAAPPDAAA